MKKAAGDGKLIMISVAVRGINVESRDLLSSCDSAKEKLGVSWRHEWPTFSAVTDM